MIGETGLKDHVPMNSSPSTLRPAILGTPVDAVDYDLALARCNQYVAEGGVRSITAANTHLVALARHQPDFGAVMRAFDLILPDGMPLIWTLRAGGVALKDRVYGPYFMERALRDLPPSTRHFFFGGEASTLEKLVISAKTLNPHIQIAGTLSPPFRAWTEQDESSFAATIAASNPDIIWVCLGGEKQERWIIKNRNRYAKGVFVGVGDAFALLAGERAFTPMWMQRSGLTWLNRFMQEPGRLWQRYLKFNSLFLWYLVVDTLRKRSVC